MLANVAKSFLTRFPVLHEAVLKVKYHNRPLYSRRVPLTQVDTKARFEEIFQQNVWGEIDSASGSGSVPNYTESLKRALPAFVERYDIKSMLDAPCGDFAWMKDVPFPADFRYVGGDIVSELAERLNTEFSSKNRRFIQLDVTSEALPDVDLFFCRDCFIHLSNDQVLKALQKFSESKVGFILTTQYNYGRRNVDIETGSFRQINLRAAPFNLPRPIASIVDYVYPFPPRRLSLWSRENIIDALRGR